MIPFVLGAGALGWALGSIIRKQHRSGSNLDGLMTDYLRSRQEFIETLRAASPPPPGAQPPFQPPPPPPPGAPSQPPTSLSNEELKEMRESICDVVRRYAEDPGELDAEKDIFMEALDTLMDGLNQREKESMIEFAKKQCPELGWMLQFVTRGRPSWPPDRPTEPPFEPPGPDVPSVDPFRPDRPPTQPRRPVRTGGGRQPRPGAIPIPTGGGAQAPAPTPTSVSTSTSFIRRDDRRTPSGPVAPYLWRYRPGGFQLPGGLTSGGVSAAAPGGTMPGGFPSGILSGNRLPAGGSPITIR